MTRLNLIVEAVHIRVCLEGNRGDNPLKDVQRFCNTYGVRLVGEKSTTERGFRELMYYFSDDLGGYTIEGIRKSL